MGLFFSAETDYTLVYGVMLAWQDQCSIWRWMFRTTRYSSELERSFVPAVREIPCTRCISLPV